MHNHLIPVLVLLVLPALYLAHRLRLTEHPRVRWLGGGALAAAVLASAPWEGVDFLYVKRINLFICLGVVLLLLGRRYGAAGLGRRGRFLTVLTLTAAFTVTVYTNFFAFHGLRTFIHLHDAAHYYLGSKYYAEAGYADLYTAMLRAEAELYDNRFKTVTARDLHTYEEVHIRALLQASEPVKAAFAGRWDEFKDDVAFFREALGEHYPAVLKDHGFNATPAWALIGGALSRRVPAGSRRGILLLCLLDVGLLVAVFAAVGWAFGRVALLLALIHFCVIFGANFGWTGGAFLRYLWFFGVVVGVCCLKKRRDASAGALLAFATLMRIFPVVFAVPIVLKGLALAWRHRTLPRRQAVFLGSFLATAAVLFALTGLLPRGYGHWGEFREQMELHVANISPNVVGLTEVLAYRGGDEQVSRDEFLALKARRQRIHTAQLLFVFLPALAAAAWLARRRTDVGAVTLALPLLLLSVSLGAYYQVFLVLLVLWQRDSPHNLALIFAVEAASHGLMLFEDREALLFIYRSVLLLVLYLGLFSRPGIPRDGLSVGESSAAPGRD